MAQKKRGANPIRITLTEDQISDIIQSAAKTRRGLRVENLEDRIAPSAIGAPMFDPSIGGGGPAPIFDPANPPLPPLGGEPPLPFPTDIDPLAGSPPAPEFVPGGPVPPLGGEPPLPFPPSPDATFGAPPVPDGIPGDPLHPIAPPGDLAGPNDLRIQHHQDIVGQHVLPTGGDPALSGGIADAPVDPADYQQANHQLYRGIQINEANGAPLPTADEIDEHRRNILRQLRGA